MPKNIRTKFLFIAAVLLFSILGVTGFPKSAAELRSNLSNNVKLGLDLRGGSHMVMQVQVQDAAKAEADQVIEQLRDGLQKGLITYQSLDRNDPQSVEAADSIEVTLRGVDANRASDVRSLVADRFPGWQLNSRGNDYRLTMTRTALLDLKRNTVERSITTLSQRINGLGLTEPVVQAHGRADAEHEILVQLPGVDDPARIKSIMQTTAQLEFAEVLGGPFPSQQDALSQSGGVLPPGSRLVKERSRGGAPESWLLVSRTAVVRGSDLRDARPNQDQFGKYQTEFFLKSDGARRFEAFTGNNTGKRMAIILDNQVYSAPTIQARISDTGVITGAANVQESSDLSLVLRAGALPASLTYLEERTVGPSLGADSIRQGVLAGVVGLAMVIAVMLVYYKASGMNAVLALLLNTVITVAALSYFDAVWTLPGIAGLILSIGMAVDSNVLIFERIKEELRAGKPVSTAISSGFDRAFTTIVDTHVTTVVSSLFLFLFGTGPIKGFAVTLVIGLIANVFTAVFVSRVIFDWTLARSPRLARLSI